MHYELLKDVVDELSEKISGARVAKIYQPAADLILFRLWTGQENLRLLISADPQAGRVHLTNEVFPNPFTPPRFCQLLRARVSRIISINLLNNDRIVSFRCSGPRGLTKLVVELLGRSSNMLLIEDNDVIIDVLHRHQADVTGRQLSSGQPYQLPDKNRGLPDGKRPTLADDRGLSASEVAENLYSVEQANGSKTDLSSLVRKAVKRQQKKLVRRFKKISEEQASQMNSEQNRQFGDLLLANQRLVKKGMTTVMLKNYYLQPPALMKIPLDERLSPQANAELYFIKYKKAKRGLEHSRRRLLETQEEQEWLDSILFQLSEAETAEQIEAIASECRLNGLLPERGDRFARKQKQIPAQPLEAVSPNGYKILWGRNNRQNDFLTTKQMKTGDLWFHALSCPGAHVVLKGKGGAIDSFKEDILYAAALAAGYSKAREDNTVEVMMAEPKHVHKPKGAKPGLVRVRQHKTLSVKPLRLD